MREQFKFGLILTCAFGLCAPITALAQTSFEKTLDTRPNIEAELLSSIGVAKPKLTPLSPKATIDSLPVKILYDGPKLEGNFILDVLLSKPDRQDRGRGAQPVSKTTLYLAGVSPEIDILQNLPAEIDELHIEASVRDSNQNLILETPFPLPVISADLRIIRLSEPNLLAPAIDTRPNFSAVETIFGNIALPPKSTLPHGSTLHVQLLENALAGGLSMELIAQTAHPAVLENGSLKFELQRGLWERSNEPDMSLKAWITDGAGRKVFIMKTPTGYNGPDIDYTIKLEGLKQGRDTKRGVNLSAELMAQTLIQGEAAFDPVIGIPSQARLSIKLKQDRGDYNRNPILAEQTLLLRGMETRIPFTLTTDSTNFDPYAPAPFLSIALTDINGHIYYESGDIRAREDTNFLRLHPR